MPGGLARTVLPAAPDAWITALRRWGTRSFGEVAAAAIDLCLEGFPVYETLAMRIANAAGHGQEWPTWGAVFMPEGRPPRTGELLLQREAGRTLERMADAERRASGGGRDAGLQAARDEFYKGETAERIARYMRAEGGLLTYDDLASYHVQVADPVSAQYNGWRVYTSGAWCQGPALAEAINILAGCNMGAMQHNSAEYLHMILEALKLAFADREAYIGDPDFVDVPVDVLVSSAYADVQRRRIDARRASPGLPQPGDAGRRPAAVAAGPAGSDGGANDTTHVSAVDRWGNAFSATPSDGFSAPVIPGVGMVMSTRGSQSWLDPTHPSVLAPGKRPRLTPNPAIAVSDGFVLPFGTPGGDVQIQAMVQTFLNMVEFGMLPQQAIEAPRVSSYSPPNSFWPHGALPGVVRAESRIPAETREALAGLGHKMEAWPDWTWLAGGMTAILANRQTGGMTAGADPRRETYALGW
jgi:gamma-glutamyltranspeptidase/glutathione hydrolase